MNPSDLYGATFCTGNAALAGGTTTTLNATATTCCINGKVVAGGTVSNDQPVATDLNTGAAFKAIPPGYGSIFVCGYTSTGDDNLYVVQGEIVPIMPSDSATDYVPGAFIDAPEFPLIPDTMCPIGYITCKVANTYTAGATYTMFTSGTTVTGAQNSAATAFANLFHSVMVLPNRPELT